MGSTVANLFFRQVIPDEPGSEERSFLSEPLNAADSCTGRGSSDRVHLETGRDGEIPIMPPGAVQCMRTKISMNTRVISEA